MEYYRSTIVDLANSWVGLNEADGSHKKIIDIYNSNPPKGVSKMSYTAPWCACTWSALYIAADYTEITTLEISCNRLIAKAQTAGMWVEDDAYIPKPGDGILYDWQDNGVGDNAGVADHIGTITYVNKESGYMVVVEGNYSNAVKKRTISLNGKYIRGFVTPKFTADSPDGSIADTTTTSEKKDINTIAKEVIAGMWGSGSVRKNKLTEAGYNYTEVQGIVNKILNGSATVVTNNAQPQNQTVAKEVKTTCYARKKDLEKKGTYMTTAKLYCRNDAGTNKKALCLIPKDTAVKCYGYYNVADNEEWLLITVALDGIQYTGFCHSGWLRKV